MRTRCGSAGKESRASVEVNIDWTLPTITAGLTAVPNSAGWLKDDAAVTFTCDDSLSGIASCPAPIEVSEGPPTSYSGEAVDVAGNRQRAELKVGLDRTPPTITARIDPPPNPFGWINSKPTVTFTCADALSGIVFCSEPISVAIEDGIEEVVGTARDAAGNEAAERLILNIDTTLPVVAITAPATGTVVTTAPTVLSATIEESGSGLDSVSCGGQIVSPGPTISCAVELTVGVNTLTVTATDRAGNTATQQTTITYQPDSTPPRLLSITPANNALDVPVTTSIEIRFSEPLAQPTITEASVRVTINGEARAGQFVFLDDDATVRFTPAEALPLDVTVITELTAAVTDLFGNALVGIDGQPITTPLTFTFLTERFAIKNPIDEGTVLENESLLLRAVGASSLNMATVVFEVNGLRLPAAAGPAFATPYPVPSSASVASLRIVALAFNAQGVEVARDQITVRVVPVIVFKPRLVGVPLHGHRSVVLALGGGAPTDIAVDLTVANPASVGLESARVVIPAGQSRVVVNLEGLAAGSTAVMARSSRGNAVAVASVSAPSTEATTWHAAPVGLAVRPGANLGRVFVPLSGQRTVTLKLLNAPATGDTPVLVSSSNAAVASATGSVVIPAGAQEVSFEMAAGVQGLANLTFQMDGVQRQLSVVVGAIPQQLVPPTLARSPGLVVRPPVSAGALIVAPASQQTAVVSLVSTPAETDVPVTVTSSAPAIARVDSTVVLRAGEVTIALPIITGSNGTATLTLRFGSEIREFTVVVGAPTTSSVRPTLARPVGVNIRPAPMIGRAFAPVAGQQQLRVQILSAPASAPTTVSVTSSNGSVATATATEIAVGQTSTDVTIATGISGLATLTFRAGTEVRDMSVIVGQPPGAIPVTIAPVVGMNVLPARSAGHAVAVPGGQQLVSIGLLSSPATSDTPVEIRSSNPDVATVGHPVTIRAGEQAARFTVQTGIEGVAVLRVRAGDEVREVTVIVGTPPAGAVPTVTARPVGIRVP